MSRSFVEDHDRLTRLLETSLEKEARLLQLCRQLKDQVVEKSIQVSAATRQKANDDLTIETLRAQCEKATAEAKKFQGRDVISKETLANLRLKVDDLNERLKQRDDTLQDLQKQLSTQPLPASSKSPPTLTTSSSLFLQWKHDRRLVTPNTPLPSCCVERARTAPLRPRGRRRRQPHASDPDER